MASYFDYLLSKVDALYGKYNNRKKLCTWLYNHQFVWDYTIPFDSNMAAAGITLRRLFSEENGCATGIEDTPCNLFEMLVSLAISMEEIMGDPYNEHPERWFWIMMDNLGIGMNDKSFNEQKLIDKIGFWSSRQYDESGHGGMFPLTGPCEDQRKATIWDQACAYLCEHMKGGDDIA